MVTITPNKIWTKEFNSILKKQHFCVVFQLYPDFRPKPGCNWNSTQKLYFPKTMSSYFWLAFICLEIICTYMTWFSEAHRWPLPKCLFPTFRRWISHQIWMAFLHNFDSASYIRGLQPQAEKYCGLYGRPQLKTCMG